MTLSVSYLSGIKSTIKCQDVPNSVPRHNHLSIAMKPSCEKINISMAPMSLLPSPSWYIKDVRWCIHSSATDGSKITTDSSNIDSANTERPVTKLSPSVAQSDVNVKNKTTPQTQETVPLRSALTAREKLRAARVLSKYTDSKPTKLEPGSKVLDALRESERGKKKTGLPEAPTNLFDDSKRGMPKQGLTFDFPGGADLFFVVLSFVLISTIMFATTYFVWKVGAIHFNE